MNTAPTIKLHLYFARHTDTAVILRQGASKVFRMILWHRGKDTFEDGQWLKSKIYTDLCDLSPDGRYFLYFALDGDWGGAAQGCFTAISHPPYFTALSLSPNGDTWSGGGVFIDNTSFVADGDADIIERCEDMTRFARSYSAKDKRLIYFDRQGRVVSLPDLHDPDAPYRSRPNADRTHPDYETEGAKLFRVQGSDRQLIRDFSDMEFEPIRAPYDWRDRGESGHRPWHPLDGERR